MHNFIHNILYSIVLLFAVFSSVSCEKNCLKAAGEIDSTLYELMPFNDIHIYDIFNVEIRQDSFYSVQVKTNSTLLKNISVVQNDTSITIVDSNKCYPLRKADIKIDLIITSPEIKHLNFYNASTFYTKDTLYYNRFLFRAYGKLAFADFKVKCDDHLFLSMWNVSGNIKVGGSCKYLQILNHGNGYIDAFNLKSKYAQITQKSTGDIKTNVSNKITATIYDSGNIYYKGNPVIDTTDYYTGTLIDAN